MKREKVKRPNITNDLENEVRRYLWSLMKDRTLTLSALKKLVVFMEKRPGSSLMINNLLNSAPSLWVGKNGWWVEALWTKGKWEANF